LTAAELSVVIPTRDRWPILAQTLAALSRQTVSGFEVVVVVDGTDQQPPSLQADRLLVKERGGPGAARNHAVSQLDRRLVLFLGDDILPTRGLVEGHLAAHAARPEQHVAVLGRTEWHASVDQLPVNRWLDWSSSQFDYAAIGGDDAGWGRFYSSNVSLKREFFVNAGGFDEDFVFDYEDLDMAYRLHVQGLELRYARAAVGHHLHPYDWSSLTRRYHSKGTGERMMANKHAWFEPFFAARIRAAEQAPRVSPLWPALARRDRRIPARLRGPVRARANNWFHQQLSAPFFGGWYGPSDVDELQAYLGADYDDVLLRDHREQVDAEERAAGDEETFYKTSRMYLYDLTMFSMWGTKHPYLAALRQLVPPGARVLDYGCGIGTDGLRLLDEGYAVEFADFQNPSTDYLRWRLDRRGHDAAIYDVTGEVAGGHDVVFCFDVIEHVHDPFEFLSRLEALGDVVLVNFLEPDPTDTHLHHALPLRKLMAHATRKGLLHYSRYERRSHLVAYRAHGHSVSAGSVRRLAEGRADLLLERLTDLPPKQS
jgi:hypothetical protein